MDPQSPIISIITPTYNRANLLGRVWRSLEQQDFRRFEWIVVDDGSTDDTRAVLAGLKDERIRYTHQANGGINSAKSTGERLVRGRFVMFLDSDDALVEGPTLSFMLEELNAAPPEIACIGVPVLAVGGLRVVSIVPEPRMIVSYEDVVCERGPRGEFLYLFRKHVLAERGWSTSQGECIRIYAIARNHPFLFVNRPGRIYYTNAGDNSTSPKNTVKQASAVVVTLRQLLDEHGDVLRRNNPKLYGEYLYKLALNEALANLAEDAKCSLQQSWRHGGPKAKIAVTFASLFAGPRATRHLFLTKSRLQGLR